MLNNQDCTISARHICKNLTWHWLSADITNKEAHKYRFIWGNLYLEFHN